MDERIKKLMTKDKEYLVKLLIQTEDAGKIALKALTREKQLLKILIVNHALTQQSVDAVREGLQMVNNGYIALDELLKI